MSGHGLDRTDVGLVGEIAKGDLICRCLGDVVELGAGSVGVDVEIVLPGIESGLFESQVQALRLGVSVRPYPTISPKM